MNSVSRIALFFLLVIQGLVTISCSSTGSNSAPTANVEAPQDAPVAGGMGSDRTETISKDLDNTVETVKGRDFSLPQRGVFFSLGMLDLERTSDSGDERTGSDSDITSVTVGYDQVVSDSWVVGTVLDLSRREVFSASDLEDVSNSSDSLSLFVFSNFAVNESIDFSGYAGLGRADTSSRRITESGSVRILDQATNMAQPLQVEQGEAQGESNSDIFSAGLFITRRTAFGVGNQFIMVAEADFSRITTDAFTEQGSTNSELAYRDDTRENMRWSLSGGLSRAYSSSVGVFVPTITLAYIRENRDDDAIVAGIVSNPIRTAVIEAVPTDPSYGKVDLDLVWVRPRGIQFFGNVNSNFKNRFEDSTGVNVGARLEF